MKILRSSFFAPRKTKIAAEFSELLKTDANLI